MPQRGHNACFSLSRTRHQGLGAQPAAARGACSLLLGFRGTLDRDGRLEHGAAGANLGRLDRTTEATCAGCEVSCLDFFVVSVALAHLVLEVNRVEISPTTPHCQSHIVGAHCFLPKFHSYVSTSVMLLSYYYFSLLPVFCDTHDDHEGANLDQSCQQ